MSATADRALKSASARAIGAVVARFVHTEEVTGSNPVSPTRQKQPLTCDGAGTGAVFIQPRVDYVSDGPASQEELTMRIATDTPVTHAGEIADAVRDGGEESCPGWSDDHPNSGDFHERLIAGKEADPVSAAPQTTLREVGRGAVME
jgi:hypothetical protein